MAAQIERVDRVGKAIEELEKLTKFVSAKFEWVKRTLYLENAPKEDHAAAIKFLNNFSSGFLLGISYAKKETGDDKPLGKLYNWDDERIVQSF